MYDFHSSPMLQDILKSFQLTPKEIKVFLKVLELGSQPASQIARLCDLPRNTVRSMLDQLVKKGLLVKTRRANTQYYATERKENLIKYLRLRKVQMQDEIERQVDLLESYGDELTVRHWALTRPRITFYEGIAGLERVYEDTLTAKNGLKSWASCDELLEVMPKYFETYFKRRAKKGIPMRSIHPDTPEGRKIVATNMEVLRDSALIPKDKFFWTPEIQIYNDKVNIASWKEKLGVIIESQEIADAMRMIFDLSFEAAERYGQRSGIKDYDGLVEDVGE
jgi:sugar-specific transcriptional regulator TrmB